jgi:hypothetical protein
MNDVSQPIQPNERDNELAYLRGGGPQWTTSRPFPLYLVVPLVVGRKHRSNPDVA